MKVGQLSELVMVDQLISMGKQLVILFQMMFCLVWCFRIIVQIMMQKKMVEVESVVVSQLVVVSSQIVEMIVSVQEKISVLCGFILFVISGWFLVWCMWVLML